MPREKTRTVVTKDEREDHLKAQIIDIARRAKLDSWSSFVETLQVPAALAPALMTNRPELLRLAQPEALSAEEVAKLYKLIAGLMEANNALQEHASDLAKVTTQWNQQLNGLHSLAQRIIRFANFEHRSAAEIDDDEMEG